MVPVPSSIPDTPWIIPSPDSQPCPTSDSVLLYTWNLIQSEVECKFTEGNCYSRVIVCANIHTYWLPISIFSWSSCFKISSLLLTELEDFRSTLAIHQHTGPHLTSSPPKISPHSSTLSPAAMQGAASAVASSDLPKHRQDGCLPALLPSQAARPLLAQVSLL